jgi:predicted site-specific integrase-resolvase
MTLLKIEKEKKIEIIKTIGGNRKYNVQKYIDDNIKENIKQNNEKQNICYVHVSTIGQKNDLEHQKEYMIKQYNNYILIEDIGSGINFNRKGFRKIIKLAMEGKINKLVVAHKDRLTRFVFEFIEDLIKEYSNGEIIIENDKIEKRTQRKISRRRITNTKCIH